MVEEVGRKLLCIRSRNEMAVARFGQTGTQRVEITSWETPERKLVRFVTELGFGSGTVTHRGRSENGALVIETITEGKTQTASIPWDPAWGGFFAAEQHLSKTPMRPGEKQSFKALVPLFNQVADIEMQAVGPESTELLSGRKELLRIDTKTRLGGGVIESVVWADDQGEPLKESLPALDQVTYRTTRDVALQNGPQPASFDLGWGSVVKVNKRLLRPHETRRVVYLARMKKGDPSASFFKGTTQSVRRVEGNAAEITVRSVRPGVSSDGYPAEPSPGREELSPGSYIQSDDARVVSMAQSVQPASTDAWSLACALERHVCEAVLTKSFAQSLATAADVAKTLEGDCTEHAVLLAAVCRARKIPSRVAMGLVYYPQSRGFAYHMWTEVWIEGGWVPIDGTLGMGGIGAAHLKVCHSNLDGPQSLGVFLSIFELLGQLDLEILSADPPESIESLAP
jgi:transglutaminase-like putative cysteine protease